MENLAENLAHGRESAVETWLAIATISRDFYVEIILRKVLNMSKGKFSQKICLF